MEKNNEKISSHNLKDTILLETGARNQIYATFVKPLYLLYTIKVTIYSNTLMHLMLHYKLSNKKLLLSFYSNLPK